MKKTSSENERYCYFVQSFDSGGWPVGYFKVGVSNKWKRRIGEISNGVPFMKLKPIYVIQSSKADQLERAILKKFKNTGVRVKGEWFYIQESREEIGGIERSVLHKQWCDVFKEEIRDFIVNWVGKNNAGWAWIN